jgi:polysaccharide export outer membrane protein
VLAVAVASVIVAARADDQPKYATMAPQGRIWAPPPQEPQQDTSAQQQPPVAAPTAQVQQQSLPPPQQHVATPRPAYPQQPQQQAATPRPPYWPQPLYQPRPLYQPQQGSDQPPPQQQQQVATPRPVYPQQPLYQPRPNYQPQVAMAPSTRAPMGPAYAGGSASSDYRLGTGDKVRVTVFGEDDLSGEFQIDSTGFVRMPMIGQVRAAGLTAQALEGGLTQAYANGYLLEPRVSVEVTTYRPFYIIGEVNKPGEYSYVNGMNVLNAIALAGGFTPHAVESHVYLRKNGTQREIEVAADQTTQIMPGDIVRVTSSTFWDFMDVISPLSGFYRRY